MKKIFVTLAALAMIIPAWAQNNARTIISLTPALPSTQALMEDFKENHAPYEGYDSPGGNPLQAFLDKHYEAEHTLSIDDAVEDIAVICHRHGGALVL